MTEFGAADHSQTKEEPTVGSVEWQQSEIDSLTTLQRKFRNKYKRTYSKLEEAKTAEEARELTSSLYFGFMQRVMKAAGVERGALLL